MNPYEAQRRTAKALALVEQLDVVAAKAAEAGAFATKYAFARWLDPWDKHADHEFWFKIETAAGVLPSSEWTRNEARTLLLARARFDIQNRAR